MSTSTAGTTGGGGTRQAPGHCATTRNGTPPPRSATSRLSTPAFRTMTVQPTPPARDLQQQPDLSVATGSSTRTCTPGYTHYVSALTVDNSQTYGRYESVSGRTSAPATGGLATVAGQRDWAQGEVDFPEAGLGDTIAGYLT